MQQRRFNTPTFLSGWLYGDAYIVRSMFTYNRTSGCYCKFVFEHSAYDGTAVQYANVKINTCTDGTKMQVKTVNLALSFALLIVAFCIKKKASANS